MFSLIVVVLSIALAAALGGALIYLGGDTYSEAALETQVLRKQTEGNQLVSAMELYGIMRLDMPSEISELVPTFVSNIPSGWQLDGNMLYVPTPEENICRAYNVRINSTSEIEDCSVVEAQKGNQKHSVCCRP